jgi:hypothetical protein
MYSDIFGNDVSLTSLSAQKSWDDMQLGFLAHSASTPNHLASVLEQEPNFALGHAVKGLFYIMLGRRELLQIASEALVIARHGLLVTQANHREVNFVKALEHWLNKKPLAARACMEENLRVAPQDVLSIKISHAISFILGDAKFMRASIEAVLPTLTSNHAGYGYVKGCHAFALEETGDYERAVVAGAEGMSFASDDAWGLHAVAHVFDMTANAKAGIAWLENKETAWAHCNNFRYHVWWHKALMHLDQGDVGTVFQLYDAEIRSNKTDDYRDISNATSLLCRLGLDGINVGNRWEELAAVSENRTEDGCLVFADLHYLLALMGGNRATAIQTIVTRLHKDSAVAAGTEDATKPISGPKAAAGLVAFGEGNYQLAFQNLTAARRDLFHIGGSHAQRDVFDRLTIDSGIRSGNLDAAKAVLDDRLAKRGGNEDKFASVRYGMIALCQAKSNQARFVAAE